MNSNEHKSEEVARDTPTLILHWDVFEKVVTTIGTLKAESGGAIGGEGDTHEVSHFHFDESSRNSAVTYSPDYKLLNRLFKSDWNPHGIRLRGFIHSHPGRMGRPSYGDEVYAERILKAIDDLECLWLPIVNTIPDTGVFRITPWAAFPAKRGVTVVKGRIQVLHAPSETSLAVGEMNAVAAIREGMALDEIVIGDLSNGRAHPAASKNKSGANGGKKAKSPLAVHSAEEPNWREEAAASFNVRNTFDRVQKAYDLALMRQARIIAVGAGGAADWLEALARAGVGQFVMIDPDVVSETNLATQQTYRRDIGLPKVDCIAARIRDINPTARTVAVQKYLDDLTDEDIRRLAAEEIDGHVPRTTLICGLTDNFFAQARVNRLALHLGLPSLCAQVYLEGRGAEITFTYPGVTPACSRCILSSRYQHFLLQGLKNDVTSHGTPIFATTRLNSLKGFLALALIHHGSEHPRWGRMLSRIGNRNLVQLRMDPDFAETLGMKVFDRVFEGADRSRLFFDEVVWLPQEEECPATGYAVPCPDCGGTGDLRDAIGKFDDTRLVAMDTSTTTPAAPRTHARMRRAVEAYKQTGGAK